MAQLTVFLFKKGMHHKPLGSKMQRKIVEDFVEGGGRVTEEEVEEEQQQHR